MATGHILPGYGDPVNRLMRVRSAGYPLDKKTLLEIAQQTKIEQQEFDSIRNSARRLWARPDQQETHYGHHYGERPADELMTLRPTSPTRRNRPHPPHVFLTNRLHYVPGYANADATVGKETYQVDASTHPIEQAERKAVRRKYLGRQEPGMSKQFSDPYQLKEVLDSRTAHAVEAWCKIADDDDREGVLNCIQRAKESQREEEARHGGRAQARSAFASTSRWMRTAGAQEKEAIGRVLGALNTDPDGTRYTEDGIGQNTMLNMRMRDIARTANVRRHPQLSRGDYVMHPDWNRCNLPHHRVP